MANPFWWLYSELNNDEDKSAMIKKELIRIGDLVNRNPSWGKEFLEFNRELRTELRMLRINQTEPKFIQHNDDYKRTTTFQCPKCFSYNTGEERVYDENKPVIINKYCEDCRYSHVTDLTKEDDQ